MGISGKNFLSRGYVRLEYILALKTLGHKDENQTTQYAFQVPKPTSPPMYSTDMYAMRNMAMTYGLCC